jgi:hypothetical protein
MEKNNESLKLKMHLEDWSLELHIFLKNQLELDFEDECWVFHQNTSCGLFPISHLHNLQLTSNTSMNKYPYIYPKLCN